MEKNMSVEYTYEYISVQEYLTKNHMIGISDLSEFYQKINEEGWEHYQGGLRRLKNGGQLLTE